MMIFLEGAVPFFDGDGYPLFRRAEEFFPPEGTPWNSFLAFYGTVPSASNHKILKFVVAALPRISNILLI
jgi:hypothetical protein